MSRVPPYRYLFWIAHILRIASPGNSSAPKIRHPPSPLLTNRYVAFADGRILISDPAPPRLSYRSPIGENDGALSSPTRKGTRAPRPRGPVLAQEDTDTALSLTNELTGLCATRDRFSDVNRREITAAANDLSMYRSKSFGTAKRSTREARRFFPDGLRLVEKKGRPDAAFPIEIFGHLPPNTHLGHPRGKVRLRKSIFLELF